VSTSIFTIALLRPAVEIVVVIDRFVGGAPADRPRERVERILTEGNRGGLFAVAEIHCHRLSDDGRDAPAAAMRLVAELLVSALGQPEVGRGQLRHGDIMVPRYRVVVNAC
jgi:hypothetical protein